MARGEGPPAQDLTITTTNEVTSSGLNFLQIGCIDWCGSQALKQGDPHGSEA